MKYVKQFFLILSISLAGEALNALIPLTIPASIYGVLILFFLLLFGVVRVESIKEVSSFLIEVMPIMFIPSLVGLMNSFDQLLPSLFSYVAVMVISTFVVMIVSGRVAQAMLSKSGKEEENEHA